MSVFDEFIITILLSLALSIVVYFIFSYLTREPKRSDFRPIKQLSRKSADRLFLLFTIVYIAIFSTLSVLRHLSFHTGGYDLGVFDQAIWNSLHGRLLEASIVPDTPVLIGQRFDPILLAFVPLYAISSDPIVLLIIQTIALAVAAFPIYWFAREQVGPTFALAVGIAFFLYSPLEYVNLFDFHEVPFTALFFSFGTLFLLRKHYAGFLVCLGLALLTKEEIALSAIAFGAFVFLIQHKRRLGLGLALGGLLWGFVVLQYVLPFFRGTEFGTGYYYFGHGMNAGHGRYDYLGETVGEVAVTLLTRPDIYLKEVLIPAKFEYLLHFFVPLAFVPLAGIELMALAFPTLGINILSAFLAQYTIETHYAGALLPFPFFATALGLKRILGWNVPFNRHAFRPALFLLMMSSTVINYYFHSPGPFSQRFSPADYTITSHVLVGNDLMHEFPSDAVLVTQKQLAPHLTNRRKTYEHPFILDYRQADYLFLDTTHFWYGLLRQSWDGLFETGYYEKIKEKDGYLIARRIAPQHVLDIQYGNQMTLMGYTIPITESLRGGQVLRPIVEWRADQDIHSRYMTLVYLSDPDGHIWAKEEHEPQNGYSHTDQWTVGQQFGDQYSLKLPSTMPPGDYQIAVSVKNPLQGRSLSAQDRSGGFISDEPVIATVHVEKDKSSILASQLIAQLVRDQEAPYVLFVDMQEIRLFGYITSRETVAPGELLRIGLYWRARAKPHGDYTVAVQLRDANSNVAYERTARPANSTYPTTQWDEGEVLLDWHDFVLPRNLPSGKYQVAVVLRDVVSNTEIGETLLSAISVVE